jgi:hypothetical protein
VADLFSQRFDVPFFVTKLILVFCYKSRRQLHLQGFTHAYSFIFKVAALAGLLAYGLRIKNRRAGTIFWFLKDYSNLKETTSASGKPELRGSLRITIRKTTTVLSITRSPIIRYLNRPLRWGKGAARYS